MNAWPKKGGGFRSERKKKREFGVGKEGLAKRGRERFAGQVGSSRKQAEKKDLPAVRIEGVEF